MRRVYYDFRIPVIIFILFYLFFLLAAHCFYDRVTNRRYPSSDFELAVGKYTVSYDIRDFPETTIFNVRGFYTRFLLIR